MTDHGAFILHSRPENIACLESSELRGISTYFDSEFEKKSYLDFGVSKPPCLLYFISKAHYVLFWRAFLQEIPEEKTKTV